MNKKTKGIIFILIAALFFALMNMFVKATGDLPFFQKSFFRNLVSLIVSFSIFSKSSVEYKMNKDDFIILLKRATMGTIGIMCNFYAVDHLILADANMLNKLSPFFAIIFSYFLLKEKPSKIQIISLVIAFSGALLIIKPGFGLNSFAAIIGLIGGLSAGLAYTYVRILGIHNMPNALIVLGFSIISTLASLPMTILNWTPMSISQFIMLLMAGLMATIAQFSLSIAYRNSPAKELSVYDYSQIVYSAIIGFIVFNQVPDKYSIVGYILVIGVAVLMFLLENDYIKLRRNNYEKDSRIL